MEHPPQAQPVHTHHQTSRELHFLVEHDGVVYLAQATAAYDPAAKGLTPEQQVGTAEMRGIFEHLGADALLRAVRVKERHNFSGSRTGREGDPGWPPTG